MQFNLSRSGRWNMARNNNNRVETPANSEAAYVSATMLRWF